MQTAHPFDAETYKDTVRQEWREAAPGWRTWYPVLEAEQAHPRVGRTLIEQADLTPGDRVLDVGAGYGEPGLTAARAVAPGGRVVLQDLAGDMLAFARERAEQLDLGDVEVEVAHGDVEELDLEPGALDAILARSVLMYLVDPAGTLERLRPALRPGGRLAASTWSAPDKVAIAAPVPLIRDMLELPGPPPGQPGLFALADPDKLAAVVADAGFAEVRTGTAQAVFEFASPDEATQFLRDCAPPVTALVAEQPPDVQAHVWARVTEEAWAPFATPDGRVHLPNEANWVAAVNDA